MKEGLKSTIAYLEISSKIHPKVFKTASSTTSNTGSYLTFSKIRRSWPQ